MRRIMLKLSVALSALSSPAYAQTRPPVTVPDPEPAADAAPDRQGGLDDIVVTAQRRAQNIQDVPIAISAISGDALTAAGIRDPRDLTLLVPSLSFQAGTAATTTSLFIRGVGISDFNSNTTGAVGVYVDDVFLGANAGKLFNVFDSAGIEVLKGPQGTLYGRNTTAGAIRFSSRKPTEEFSLDAAASYGRFNEVRLEAGVGGAIVPDLVKVRVAGFYNRRDGTTLNRVTGNRGNNLDIWAGRGIVDITPSSDLLFRLTVHGGQNRGGARQFQHRGTTGAVTPGGFPLDAFGYADTDNDVYAGDYDIEGPERVDVFGASLLTELKLDAATITSITAYEQVNRFTFEDSDASPNNILTATYIDRPRQFSQELRVASPEGSSPFTWVLGGFFFHDRLATDSQYDILRLLRDPAAPMNGFDPANSIGVNRFPYTQRTTSLAAFGQADYKLTDRLTATLGVRASRDRIEMDYRSFFDEAGFIVPLVDFKGKKTFNDLSYRAALSYKIDRTLLYASYSKGYNSGGFAGGAATDLAQLTPFGSERLFSYEVGVKTELLDRKLRFNTAAFYYDYDNLQVFVYDTTGIIPIQRKLNAGSAQIYGLESEISAQPTPGLNIFLSGSLLHSEYKTFTALAADNYKGNRLVNAPTLAISGGVTVTRPIGAAGSIRGRIDGSYQSNIFLTPDNAASSKVGGYGILNGRLSWLPNDRFELAIWGKNITGTRYVNFVAPIITSDELNYNDPRTYGVEAIIHF